MRFVNNEFRDSRIVGEHAREWRLRLIEVVIQTHEQSSSNRALLRVLPKVMRHGQWQSELSEHV